MNTVYIIAEAGVNHNGSPELALKLVEAAHAAGADAVKFQTFKASSIASAKAGKAEYQKKTTGEGESQLDMLKKLELGAAEHEALKARCNELGIEFMSTPFDLDSVHLLMELGVQRMKIPSGELTNGPLLLAIARTGLPLILSTGMATPEEIRTAIAVLAHGMLEPDRAPDANDLATACQRAGSLLTERLTLLHCTTQYPTPYEDVNLRGMDTLRDLFNLPVGYSDHTPGITIPVAAVARGAVLIEKHFTLDKNMPGPDHKASLEPHELADMVRSIRIVEASLGTGEKKPQPSELGNIAIARKSLVAACDIKKGEPLTTDNMTVKRPGTGISPMRYWELLGTPASADFTADSLITE
ncbi:N-acetylneuraminate synthase [Desulfovibrio subterraneus]|uniref:N-acetylneuraminate synthase n=1 Tax=Desulfovibrio subterraneus TaxID=2718620 RepID=UPI0022B910E0|nr:N-acetylneuraminate synthase [Desulfovibrio subterraneus]WBF66104.1 N-acetylneuraminate synthase [Desulfovibrio subterraneus]